MKNYKTNMISSEYSFIKSFDHADSYEVKGLFFMDFYKNRRM